MSSFTQLPKSYILLSLLVRINDLNLNEILNALNITDLKFMKLESYKINYTPNTNMQLLLLCIDRINSMTVHNTIYTKDDILPINYIIMSIFDDKYLHSIHKLIIKYNITDHTFINIINIFNSNNIELNKSEKDFISSILFKISEMNNSNNRYYL